MAARYNLSAITFLVLGNGNDPSFRIESKPRIDNIDYITYICGALGTWFGICALNFNPFPIFFKPNEPIGDNTNAVNHFLVTPSRVKRLEERLAIFKLQLCSRIDRHRVVYRCNHEMAIVPLIINNHFYLIK